MLSVKTKSKKIIKDKSIISQNPTVIDMFCGCGGLSQGFKDAGFEVLFGVDHDIPSLITYDANFGIGKGKNIDLFKKDFLKKFSQELNNSNNNLDVVIAGPPCQGFSLTGPRNFDDPHFVGIGEIGLDYFLPDLDPHRQAFFFDAQLDLAQKKNLPVILHVRRSQDMILKALRQRSLSGGIAHAFNGSHQQAEQFINQGFKLGFGGAATYERALQIRRLLKELPLEAIVTETDSPDIPPAWLKDEPVRRNEPAYLPRIAQVLAGLRGIAEHNLADAVIQNTSAALPRWGQLLTKY